MIETVIAGDTLDFEVSVPDYPNTDGWTLKYRLTPRFSSPVQAPVGLTASANADGSYQVQAGPATTAAWAAGYYSVARWVEKSGARQTLTGLLGAELGGPIGQLKVYADPALTAQGFDSRSQARKAVDDLKAAMATFQSTGGKVKSYSIGSRQMEFESSAEIVQLLDFWRRQLDNEEAAATLAAGLGNPRTIGLRFNRP